MRKCRGRPGYNYCRTPLRTAPVDAPLPNRLSRYEISDRLGQGGMGILYLARDPLLDRTVAIKVLSVQNNDELRERFAREARSAASLRHNNIVTIYDVGEDRGRPFLAMEYLDGETVAELIRRRARMPIPARLQLMIELCEGLAYAHRRGVVHRDIKPANLMVTSDGVLKILDFGLAKVISSATSAGLTQAGMLLGTPHYMSPEQIQGLPVDHRSDVFAVGLVIYELLSYKRAYAGESAHAVLHNIVSTSPVPLRDVAPHLDAELDSIVAKTIEKDPELRYQDLRVLAEDLGRVRKRRLAEDETPTVRLGRGEGPRPDTPQPQATPASPLPNVTPPRPANFEAIAKRRAERISAHLQEAHGHFAAARFEQTIEACEQAALLDPSEPRVLDLLQRCQTAIDDRQIGEWMREAQSHLSSGAFSHADQAVDRILKLRPEYSDAQRLQSEVRRRRSEYERAQERARQLAAALARGRAAMENGAYDAAIRCAIEALSHDPQSAEARALKAEAVAERERVEREEEEARIREEARRRAEAEEAARREAERLERERQEAAERARLAEEARKREEARRRAEAEEAARREAERLERERREAAERARLEEEARRKEEVRRRAEAEEAARREAERLARERQAAAEQARLEEEARRKEEARRRAEAEEAARREAERAAIERQKAAERARLAEEARKQEEARRRAEAEEAIRLARERQAAERARLAEQARLAEEARLAEAARVAEEARLANEARKQEEAQHQTEAERLARDREAADARLRAQAAQLKEEARLAEAARLAEVARRQEQEREQKARDDEARRQEEAKQQEEAKRQEEARRKDEARRQEDARRKDEAKRQEDARRKQQEAAAAAALESARRQREAEIARAEQARIAGEREAHERARREEEDRRAREPEYAGEAEYVSETGLPRDENVEGVAVHTPAPERTAAGSRRTFAIAALVVTATLIAALVFWLTTRPRSTTGTTVRGGPEAGTGTGTGQRGADTGVGSGQSSGGNEKPPPVERVLLVLDAVPWAEIVSVRGPGDEAVEVPAGTVTPYTMQVPPGSYTVTFRRSARDEKRVTVDVAAGAGGRAYAEFRRVDAADYFKRAGW